MDGRRFSRVGQHDMDRLDGNSGNQYSQYVGYRNQTGSQVEIHPAGIGMSARGKRIIAVGNENLGAMPGTAKNTQNFGMKQCVFKYGTSQLICPVAYDMMISSFACARGNSFTMRPSHMIRMRSLIPNISGSSDEIIISPTPFSAN